MTPRRLITLVFATLLGLAGCYEYRVKHDGWELFRTQMGADPPGGAAPAKTKTGPAEGADKARGWAILIESFEGGNRYRRASELMRRLANRYAVSDLWYQDTAGTTRVFCGRYDSITDLEAQRALMHIRAIEEDGEKPYERVEMVSLAGDSRERVAQSNDLRAYSGQGFYTLQVGFYDDEYGPDFRDAAEAAAAELRNQGSRAFYYHGPNRSMVTVELFTDADFDQDGPVRVYGSRMLALQERYQYNLGNGRTILETIGDGKKSEKRAQPSFIVKVP